MKKIDIHRILEQRGAIAIVWDIHDVKKVRPDLSDAQAWQVLEKIEVNQDANIGVIWWTVEFVAKCLFGSPPDDDTETRFNQPASTAGMTTSRQSAFRDALAPTPCFHLIPFPNT